jgi:hypothetical protein
MVGEVGRGEDDDVVSLQRKKIISILRCFVVSYLCILGKFFQSQVKFVSAHKIDFGTEKMSYTNTNQK